MVHGGRGEEQSRHGVALVVSSTAVDSRYCRTLIASHRTPGAQALPPCIANPDPGLSRRSWFLCEQGVMGPRSNLLDGNTAPGGCPCRRSRQLGYLGVHVELMSDNLLGLAIDRETVCDSGLGEHAVLETGRPLFKTPGVCQEQGQARR